MTSDTRDLPPSAVRDNVRDKTRDQALDRDYPNEPATIAGRQTASDAPAEAVEVPQSTPAGDQPILLFGEAQVADYRSDWSSIQPTFVDEPRQAVEDADDLVKSVLKQLEEGFTQERDRLAKSWDSGDKVSTEDLRITFQRYRSFFDRLLKV